MTATAQVDQRTMLAMREAARQELELREKTVNKREYALTGTAEFGEVMGLNVYEPHTGRVPWMVSGVHGEMCDLLDRKIREIDNPIKLIAIPRGHFKTSICGCALSRIHCMKPHGRSAIFAAKEILSRKALKQVAEIWKCEQMQSLFPELLFDPRDRNAYQSFELYMDHERVGGEPSVKAFGMETSFTGMHFDTVLWVDDLIDRHMARSVDEMEKAFDSLKDLMGAVADPGCEIWMTFTRYNLQDPYGQILAEDSDYWPDIAADPIIRGCYVDSKKGRKPLFPARFCDSREQISKPGTVNGVKIDLPRKSLQAIREKYGPSFFASQYLNSPIPEGESPFEMEWFEDVIDVDGPDFFEWINVKENAKKIAPYPEEGLRGPFEVAVLGDPGYGKRSHNNPSILWVVAVDRFNHWFFLDYKRAKYGKKNMLDYCKDGVSFYGEYRDRCVHRLATWLAIEAHGTGVLLEAEIVRAEAELGIQCMKKPLKNNSNVQKELRIMSLEPVALNRRMHFCKNVVEGKDQLALESQTFMSGGEDDVIDTAANGTQVFRTRNPNAKRPGTIKNFSHLPRGIRRFLN